MSKVLVVVDMQNDFIDGSLGTKEAVAIVPKVQEKIQNGGYDKVIFTMDTHEENYLETAEGKKLPVKHCIKDTEGWKISNQITAGRDMETLNELMEKTENKKFFSTIVGKKTFGYTGWDEFIEDGDTVDIIGLCTDICVVSNALIIKAMFPENEITVDASCCAGVTPETHVAALTTMKSCQINVINE